MTHVRNACNTCEIRRTRVRLLSCRWWVLYICVPAPLMVHVQRAEVQVIVVPWLLKCVGFVPPKGYHVLPSQEVHDKPEGGDLYHNSLYRLPLMSLSTYSSVCKRLPSASAVHGVCTT